MVRNKPTAIHIRIWSSEENRTTCAEMSLTRRLVRTKVSSRFTALVKPLMCLIIVALIFKYMSQPLNWHRAASGNKAEWAKGSTALQQHRNTSLRVEIEDPEEVVQQSNMFQPVNQYEAWVYSAFYDHDDNAPGQEIVRVFGISTYNKYHVYCLVTEDGLTDQSEGAREFISDNHLQKNSAMMLLCPLKTGSRPQFVSFIFDKKDRPTNNLTIIYPKRKQRALTICHSILYNMTDHKQIVQSVEMNRVLGVEHFIVYNHSAMGGADWALRHYQRLGLMTVMNWPVPTHQVWYLGQNMAINDCVYRNRGLSTYVAIMDTDEVLFPVMHQTIPELLDSIDREVKKAAKAKRQQISVGSYGLQTSIFSRDASPLLWEKLKQNYSITLEEDRFIRENNLTIMTRLLRIPTIYPPKVRSKVIVRPEHVLVAGIHFTHFHRGKATYQGVSPSLALVHHYKCCDKGKVLDTTALQFKRKFLTRLKSTLSYIS